MNRHSFVKSVDEDKPTILTELKTILKLKSHEPTVGFVEDCLLYLQFKSKLPYQQAIGHYLNLYLCFLLLPNPSTKVTDSINRAFCNLLLLPLADSTWPVPKEWMWFYDPVKLSVKETKQKKCLILIRQITQRPPVQSAKLVNLVKRASDKEFNSIGLIIAMTHYFHLLYKCLVENDMESVPSQALIDILASLMNRFKSARLNLHSKFLAWNYPNINCFGAVLAGMLYLYSLINNEAILQGILSVNIRQKVMQLCQSNAEIYPQKLKLVESYKSTWQKLVTTLSIKVLTKSLQNGRGFIKLVQNLVNYLGSVSEGFDKLVNYTTVLAMRTQLEVPQIEEVEVVVQAYKQNLPVLLLILTIFRKSRVFLEAVSATLSGQMLKQLVKNIIELDLDGSLNPPSLSALQLQLIQFYNQQGNGLLQKTTLNRLEAVCKQSKMDPEKAAQITELTRLVSNFDPGNIDCTLSGKIITIQDQVVRLYFNETLPVQAIVQLVSRLFGQETLQVTFFNIVFAKLLPLHSTTSHSAPCLQFSELSYSLFRQVDVTICSQIPQPVYFQDPAIQLGVCLLEATEPECVNAIKKVFKYHLSRPSQTYIELRLMRNRFVLKCALLAEVKGVLKSVYEIVDRMEDNQQILGFMFPKIPNPQARSAYIRYLARRNLALFRLQMAKYSAYSEFMSE